MGRSRQPSPDRSTNEALLEDIRKLIDENLTLSADGFIDTVKAKATFQQGEDEAAKRNFKVVAVHVKKWCASLQTELMNKKIFEMYGAWCSTGRKAATGF